MLLLGLVVLLVGPTGAARSPAAVSIFYYPWYGTPALDGGYWHWQQEGHLPPRDIASSYYPRRGVYSGGDQHVLAAQMREIAAAGVGEVVSSWWGWGSLEDQRLPAVAAAAGANGLSIAVQIEPYPGRTIESVGRDIDHLAAIGVGRFYVYRPWDLADADWAALNDRLAAVQVLAQTANPTRAAAAHFDGIYTYDVLKQDGSQFRRMCARARALHLVCAPSVGPGYDASRATDDARVRPRRDGRTYDTMWKDAIAAHADRVTITSYNEWHEGTQIEPARSFAARRALAIAPVVRLSYRSYDGAYGLHGRAAATAYLARTAYWSRLFARPSP
jgi:glycoprotein endo-alpha-1,2-mannosidase